MVVLPDYPSQPLTLGHHLHPCHGILSKMFRGTGTAVPGDSACSSRENSPDSWVWAVDIAWAVAVAVETSAEMRVILSRMELAAWFSSGGCQPICITTAKLLKKNTDFWETKCKCCKSKCNINGFLWVLPNEETQLLLATVTAKIGLAWAC